MSGVRYDNRETLTVSGMDSLSKTFKEMPADVRKRAEKRGLRRAAAKLRTAIRRDAPNPQTRNLRRSIQVKRRRNGSFGVGLYDRYYYKTLDLNSARGEPLNNWFEASVNRHKQTALDLTMDELKKALAYEAGRALARSLRGYR